MSSLLRLPFRLLSSVRSQRPTLFLRRLVYAEYLNKEFGQLVDCGTQQNAEQDGNSEVDIERLS